MQNINIGFGMHTPNTPSSLTPSNTPPPKKKGFGYFVWRWVVLPIVLVFMGFHAIIAILLTIWGNQPVNNSMFMITHRLNGGTVSQEWVAYDEIAKSVKQAAIASEDATFAVHKGFDIKGIQTAMKKNDNGQIRAGGSTITQQLAKNLFLTSHRSYIRKAEEAIITVMIENMWDKQRILLVYLNVVEFGEGIYGIEAAAHHYYDKSASRLTKDESAKLIAMLPNPKYYQKNPNNKRLNNKKRLIVKRMADANLP